MMPEIAELMDDNIQSNSTKAYYIAKKEIMPFLEIIITYLAYCHEGKSDMAKKYHEMMTQHINDKKYETHIALCCLATALTYIG